MLTQTDPSNARPAPLTPAMFERPFAAWLPAVSAELDEQKRLCDQLERLGLQQSQHVASGRTDDLLAILSERQAILDRVVEISSRLEPFRENRERLLDSLPAPDRESLTRRINAIADVVDRVRRRDDQDRRVLEEQRQIVADEIAGISRLRGAAAAYAVAGQRDPRGSRFQNHHG